MVFIHQQHKPFVDAEVALANPRLTVLSFGGVAVGAVGRRLTVFEKFVPDSDRTEPSKPL